MPCRQTAVIYCLRHRFVNLGGNHRVVTSARVLGQPLTQNRLSGTDTSVATVLIGGVDKVNTCLCRAGQNRKRFFWRGT